MTTDRISRLEGAYEQVDKRLDDLQQSITSLRSDVNSRFESTEAQIIALRGEMNSRFESMESQMNSRFNQLLIFVGASWITIMAAMIGIFFADG